MLLEYDHFLVNGGFCYIFNKKLKLQINFFAYENIYKITFLVSLYFFYSAIYSYLTGTVHYSPRGVPYPWHISLLFGFLLNLSMIIHGYEILTGFTFEKEIPLDSIRSIEVFNNEGKFFRSRSNILIKYNKKGEEKKRRIILYGKDVIGSKDDIPDAMKFLDRHGLRYQYIDRTKLFL